MRRKPLIYLAGPYRIPDPVSNTAESVRIGFMVRDDLGAVPIIPHLSMFEDFHSSRTPEYWLDATMDQMRGCDAVYRFNRMYSTGADAEVAEAIRLGIPVFYELAELAVWIGKWEAERGLSDGGNHQEKPADDAGITGDARHADQR